MKIVIADDEYLVRSSLKSMLEEMALPLNLAGEATNGEELIDLAGRFHPDIALVDIRMPGINGLEAIRRGKEISPQTKWLILTGFSEFEYAKQAIQLGVSEYLLKPVSPEELLLVLSGFLEEVNKQLAAQNQQFERQLMSLQHGLMLPEFDDEDSFLSEACFEGAIFTFDSCLPEPVKAASQQKFAQSLRVLARSRSDANNRFALIVLPAGEMAAVGAWKQELNSQADLLVRKYLGDIQEEIEASSNADLGITLLASQACPTYLGFHEQLRRLCRLAPLRVVIGLGRPIHIKILEEQSQLPGRMEFSSLLLGIIRSFQEKNYLNYSKTLQDLEKHISRPGSDQVWRLSIATCGFIARSIQCSLPPGLDAATLIQSLQMHGRRILNEAYKDEIKGVDLIDQVLAFVDQNYMEDIGIGTISERLNITPNYLSTLFHRKTGVNFMSYLKNARMLKARELLSDPSLQIQQVAERVGYSSPRHFARLFTEQFGCLPSEYRERLSSGGK